MIVDDIKYDADFCHLPSLVSPPTVPLFTIRPPPANLLPVITNTPEPDISFTIPPIASQTPITLMSTQAPTQSTTSQTTSTTTTEFTTTTTETETTSETTTQKLESTTTKPKEKSEEDEYEEESSSHKPETTSEYAIYLFYSNRKNVN